jgi:ribonuclease BN (tRNA processing enzyme)
VIEVVGQDGLVKRIMTDPGAWTSGQVDERNIDLILITHEHGDHLHTESLKKVLENNPNAIVGCNESVGKILEKENIKYESLSKVGDIVNTYTLCGLNIETYEGKHGEIYKEIGQVQNTGFFLENKLFYPGDSFTNPNKPVEILAAPVYGPWVTIRNCIDYIKSVKPKNCFNVHDAMIIQSRGGRIYTLAPEVLKDDGVNFVYLKDGESVEF